MTIPRNYEREKKIMECWKLHMTIDQTTTFLNEKRSTVGYYYGKFNKAEKRGELRKYLPEEITRLDQIPSRYNNTSPIKPSDNEDNLAKYEEALMDLIFYDNFQLLYTQEDYQKAYFAYQAWNAGKTLIYGLKHTEFKDIKSVAKQISYRTSKPNRELENKIDDGINEIINNFQDMDEKLLIKKLYLSKKRKISIPKTKIEEILDD